MSFAIGSNKAGLLVMGLVAVAVAAYLFVSRPTTDLPELGPYESRRVFDEWSKPLAADWDRYVLTPLSDTAEVRARLTVLVQAAIGPEGMEITGEQRTALVEAATAFFGAWSSPTAKEYLAKIAPRRSALKHPADGDGVISTYRGFFGEAVPFGATAEQVIDRCWKGRPGCLPRPTAASFGPGEAIVDFGLKNPDRGPRASTRYGRFDQDQDEGHRWIGPYSTGVPCVTEAPESFEEVRQAHGPDVQVAFMGVVVLPPGAERCVMQLYWYWSPGLRQWHLNTIGFLCGGRIAWAF